MMIDSFNETWLNELEQRLAQMPVETNMFLLIDGVFVPGLFRSREFHASQTEAIALLFEALPACNEEARDVSPFLVPVKRLTRSFSLALEKCNGWPMVSVIETTESLADLSCRLAVWCVIEVDEQRFNFRFPDTRRLPAIFDTLTPRQRAELTGPMRRWSYIARDGNWEHLNVDGKESDIASQPVLNDSQFGRLVSDSEPEEVLLQLAYRGFEPTGLASMHHATVCMALRIADQAALAQELRCDWCEFILNHEEALNESAAVASFAAWRNGQE